MKHSKKFGGIFTRRQRWGLSGLGWLVILGMVLTSFGLFVVNIQPFLAHTERVETRILVVEGWVHEFGIRAAVDEFRAEKYTRIFTTGGPAVGFAANNKSPTAADVMADWLNYRGIPSDILQPVPSQEIQRDRTYQSAVALREWLHEHQMPIQSFNVLTEAAHARRTRLLYTKAFGNGVAIGIIAAPNDSYDPKRWWNYSDGVQDVMTETSAYLYAKLFFHPDRPKLLK